MSNLSVVIPTYNRGDVLLDTLSQLFQQTVEADGIVVVDQTQYPVGDSTAQQLHQLHQEKKIQWLRKSEPSIPKAMNKGLLSAKTDWVLFLDDDVRFDQDFIANHVKVIASNSYLAHVGQIVQPWQTANQTYPDQVAGNSSLSKLQQGLSFKFNSATAAAVSNCMAGNLCVNRNAAIDAGGFDENFFGVAYRFETEFCKRFCAHHKTEFWYAPQAMLHHLHVKKGGTRAHADYLTSSKPVHSMGDYYYGLLHGTGGERRRYIAARLFGSLRAKFYCRYPWYLPVRVLAELRGLIAALKAHSSGPRLIEANLESNFDANFVSNSSSEASQ